MSSAVGYSSRSCFLQFLRQVSPDLTPELLRPGSTSSSFRVTTNLLTFSPRKISLRSVTGTSPNVLLLFSLSGTPGVRDLGQTLRSHRVQLRFPHRPRAPERVHTHPLPPFTSSVWWPFFFARLRKITLQLGHHDASGGIHAHRPSPPHPGVHDRAARLKSDLGS